MVPRMQLLLVEDDPTMQTTLQRALTRRGMEVAAVGDGKAALTQWVGRVPDAVILDLTLPGLDGLQVLQRARALGLRTPVLILTARGTVGDRVMGLNAGADDYLVKPFQKDELLARLNALVRRSAGFISPRVKAGDYELDLSRKELTVAGEVTVLTSFEYLILEYLMRNARQVVSKQQLLDQLYGDGEGDPNTIEVMVSRLRKKLDPEGSIQPISTIRRQGYIFSLACS